jgi:hypothetical protein
LCSCLVALGMLSYRVAVPSRTSRLCRYILHKSNHLTLWAYRKVSILHTYMRYSLYSIFSLISMETSKAATGGHGRPREGQRPRPGMPPRMTEKSRDKFLPIIHTFQYGDEVWRQARLQGQGQGRPG